jgi:predicted ATPase
MHIHQIHIENIRSIEKFEMEFLPEKKAGWHVIIGDNGAGKTTIIRAIALALVGPKEALGLRSAWKDWLKHDSKKGEIVLNLEHWSCDKHTGRQGKLTRYYVPNGIEFNRNNGSVDMSSVKDPNVDSFKYNWGNGAGWFSAAYGPYRRFAGGNPDWGKVFYSQPKLGAHLSAFGEDIALSEAIDWLKNLQFQALENKGNASSIISNLKNLVNSVGFLPNNAKLESISSEGVFFKDGIGSIIDINELSDGYRSILSLTFELIRQLVRVYGDEEVFKDFKKNKMFIDLPGVVLIDEIDAHLHPTWQTRIGEWFTTYFPNLQFIVTTHSPLVCRSCSKGSIWRLAAPGSEEPSSEITGVEKDKLVYGNILDAYGTELFGASPVRSNESKEKLERLGVLNFKAAFGKVSSDEEKERLSLQKIYETDVTIK